MLRKRVTETIVDFRINGTRQTGAVENRTYRGAKEVTAHGVCLLLLMSVYFLNLL